MFIWRGCKRQLNHSDGFASPEGCLMPHYAWKTPKRKKGEAARLGPFFYPEVRGDHSVLLPLLSEILYYFIVIGRRAMVLSQATTKCSSVSLFLSKVMLNASSDSE